MPETGQTWRQKFKALSEEAPHVRAWIRNRTAHDDAPLVATELFAAVLGARPDVIDMEISTAGRRVRITATGPTRLATRHTHGPGWTIVDALSRYTGVTTDECGLWAQLYDN